MAKPVQRYGVDITPLTYVPGGRIERYLGNLNFFFIRESTSIREHGGISGFVHSFITEVSHENPTIMNENKNFNISMFHPKTQNLQFLAVVRAHITALGGNAMVSFYMSELILGDHPHKNQVARWYRAKFGNLLIDIPNFRGKHS